MKYIKPYKVNIPNEGNPEDLYQCFDGIEDLDLSKDDQQRCYVEYQNLKLSIDIKRSGINGVSVSITCNRNNSPQVHGLTKSFFTLTNDIIEEIESSVGKAWELGYALTTSFMSSKNNSHGYIFLNDVDDLYKQKDERILQILLNFTALNDYQIKFLRSKEKINESKESYIRSCFDGLADISLGHKGFSISTSFFLHPNKKHYMVLIYYGSKKWTSVPFNLVDDIKEEIISSIGKANEIGYSIESEDAYSCFMKINYAGDEFMRRVKTIEEFENLSANDRIYNILINLNEKNNI